MHNYAICLPITVTDNIIPNTLKGHCSECDQEVWTSEGTITRVNFHGFKILCINCAMKYEGVALIQLPSHDEMRAIKKFIIEQN
jgi:hypothetical protein